MIKPSPVYPALQARRRDQLRTIAAANGWKLTDQSRHRDRWCKGERSLFATYTVFGRVARAGTWTRKLDDEPGRRTIDRVIGELTA